MRFGLHDAILCIVAISLVFYAEWYYPSHAFRQCVWPLGPTADRVALIADPQLVDANTYPDRSSLFMWFTRTFADRYMARNYRLLHRNLKPDAVFFLGDLFDGGREWDDKVWYKEFRRWKHVFPKSPKVPQVLNLPGNHDVGSVNDIVPAAYERFRKEFGDPNQVLTIGDYSIVTLDTNALMNENHGHVNAPAHLFYKGLQQNRSLYGPMIVLSHMPLYRPDGAYCGFEREGAPFNWVRGHQYVTEVNPVLSQDILVSLHPTLIFSGDDHDACKYTHAWTTAEQDKADEYTVKSFSLAMGIERPGFQLLSLGSHGNAETESCLLGQPFYPLFFQLVTFGLLSAYIAIGSCLSCRRSKYDRIGDAEKGVTSSLTRRLPREGVRRLLVMTLSWGAAQYLINWWSYSSSV